MPANILVREPKPKLSYDHWNIINIIMAWSL